MVKIWRKHDIEAGKITVGQDIDGNLYGRCNVCGSNMTVTFDYRSMKMTGKPRRIAICPRCKLTSKL